MFSRLQESRVSSGVTVTENKCHCPSWEGAESRAMWARWGWLFYTTQIITAGRGFGGKERWTHHGSGAVLFRFLPLSRGSCWDHPCRPLCLSFTQHHPSLPIPWKEHNFKQQTQLSPAVQEWVLRHGQSNFLGLCPFFFSLSGAQGWGTEAVGMSAILSLSWWPGGAELRWWAPFMCKAPSLLCMFVINIIAIIVLFLFCCCFFSANCWLNSISAFVSLSPEVGQGEGK